MTGLGRGVLRRLRRGGEEGVALVVVLGTMLVLAMLAMVTLAYTVAGQKFARYDQDYAAAMSAAQSGVDDFISRLNRYEAYGLQVDCANAAWQGPSVGTNSCGWGSGTPVGWLPVKPGDTNPRDAQFHYAVDTTEKLSKGTVKLTVTGRVNGVYRTIQTAVGKGGSTDYVYYTNYESADPSNLQAYTLAKYPHGAPAVCGGTSDPAPLYWFQGRSGCVEITFISSDTLDGAVFSNDTILSDGAHFLKGVETASPDCAKATADESTWDSDCLRDPYSTADFNHIKPLYEKPLYLDDNSATFATDPGCHYFGSTRVIFYENGTMKVWNAKSVNGLKAPVAIAPPGGTAPNCGDLDALDNGATLPVPNGLVIYADASATANRQCYGGEIGGPSPSEALPLGTYNQNSTNPPTGLGQSYTYDVNMAEATKKCGNGNLYAEGVLKGQVTIAASSSVIVTGDLVLAGGLNGSDMLGLVATNSVEVFHPRMVTVSSVRTRSCYYCSYTYQWGGPSNSAEADQSPYNLGAWPKRYKASTESAYTPTTGIQIAGSIQTLQHSFFVQQYDVGGDQGTLLVNGSIAQKWRGIVGQGSDYSQNGYSKLYKYDTRLIYTRPPYFPTWANSKWQQTYSGELKTPPGVKG